MKRRSFLKMLTGGAAVVASGTSLAKLPGATVANSTVSDLKLKINGGSLQYVGRPTRAVPGDIYLDINRETYLVYDGARWHDMITTESLNS